MFDLGIFVFKKVDMFKIIYLNKIFDYMFCKWLIFMVIDGVFWNLVEEVGCGIFVEFENVEDIVVKVIFYVNM